MSVITLTVQSRAEGYLKLADTDAVTAAQTLKFQYWNESSKLRDLQRIFAQRNADYDIMISYLELNETFTPTLKYDAQDGQARWYLVGAFGATAASLVFKNKVARTVSMIAGLSGAAYGIYKLGDDNAHVANIIREVEIQKAKTFPGIKLWLILKRRDLDKAQADVEAQTLKVQSIKNQLQGLSGVGR